MTGLLAVAPDGGGVVDGDGISGEARGGGGSNGHESTVESSSFGTARVLEGALGDGMVLDLELELDNVAGSSLDDVGGVDVASGATDDNGVDGTGGANGSGSVGRSRSSRSRSGDGGTRTRAVVAGRAIGSSSVIGNRSASGGSDGGRSAGGSSLSATLCSSLEVTEGLGRRIGGSVDGEDHSLLTVVGLRAESPDGVGILDGDPELGEVVGLIGSDGHESTEESTGHQGARAGESRLGDGMVLDTKGEADTISNVGGDGVRGEGEETRATDEDIDYSSVDEGKSQGGSSDSFVGEHDC